jgi:hypothetical protein
MVARKPIDNYAQTRTNQLMRERAAREGPAGFCHGRADEVIE